MKKKVKYGDLWELGSHRLMCGDATQRTHYNKLLQDEKANLLFTDPPYGMNKKFKNDNLKNDGLMMFNSQWIPLTFEFLLDIGSWYCFGKDEILMRIYSEILLSMIKNKKITFRNLITWDKKFGFGQRSSQMKMYSPADEKCLFVMNGTTINEKVLINARNYNELFDVIRLETLAMINKAKEDKNITMEELGKILKITDRGIAHWIGKSQWNFIPEKHYNKINKLLKNERTKPHYEEMKKKVDDIKSEMKNKRAKRVRNYFDNTHDNMNSVWKFKKMTKQEREQAGGHPTPKPIELCERVLKSSTRQNEIVMDVFGGSGSTLITAENLGRSCRMLELDHNYCSIIIERWERLTGKTAKKLSVE